MIYPDNFENKIEFDAVRRMLKEHCLCSLGRERVDDMFFMTDFDAICTRLAETEESMADIADAIGFCNPNYFHKIFKQYMDVSPIAYKKTLSAKETT